MKTGIIFRKLEYALMDYNDSKCVEVDWDWDCVCEVCLSQCWEIPFFIDCYASIPLLVYLLCIKEVIVVAIKCCEASTNEEGFYYSMDL